MVPRLTSHLFQDSFLYSSIHCSGAPCAIGPASDIDADLSHQRYCKSVSQATLADNATSITANHTSPYLASTRIHPTGGYQPSEISSYRPGMETYNPYLYFRHTFTTGSRAPLLQASPTLPKLSLSPSTRAPFSASGLCPVSYRRKSSTYFSLTPCTNTTGSGCGIVSLKNKTLEAKTCSSRAYPHCTRSSRYRLIS